jgi:hypothetical protein
MILSHRYRFIFIKTSKTAGTSVEIALSRHCGPEDIITPISPADEPLRRACGGKGPQNHLLPRSGYGLMDRFRHFTSGRERLGFWNHMSAAEICARIPEAVWNSYYKFCFERNPWDRVISYYYWKHREEPRPALSEFVHSERLGKLRKQGRDLYTIGGEVVVDRVCRFEALDDELEAVCRKLGMPQPLELPRAKGGFRRDRRSYRDLLGERERQRIAEFFHDEITRLGYEF